MKNNFIKIQELERRIQVAYSNSTPETFHETKRGMALRDRWEDMILELRGWNSDKATPEYKPEWLEYCKQKDIVPDYNFGDVMC
jgi:hypothetical protein